MSEIFTNRESRWEASPTPEIKVVQSTEAVANKFIELAGPGGVSHMKLQKLIYLAHEKNVRDTRQPLVSDNPEVWQYGPVFPRIYHELKQFKSFPITQPLVFPFTGETWMLTDTSPLPVIHSIWQDYGQWSATQLSDETHKPGTPWRRLAEKFKFNVPRGLTITPSDILATR